MPFTKSSRKSLLGRDNSPEPGPSKGDKYTSDEDDEPVPRKGKSYQSSKNKLGKISKKSPNIVSKQSGSHSNHNKTAELFRKDLISAMKMADTETLYESDYVVISDPWRQEWEKGVQVPVNEDEILPVEITEIHKKTKQGDFKLPPRKYLHEKADETYQAGQHELTNMQELADAIVRYDLDDQDVSWLELVNEDREEMGLQAINEWNLERMIEELENQCYVKTNALKKTEEGLGIEYDEDVACDVCRMLESEDTNEMVFCDGCDICVHQACYGIQTIPEGSWLCRICALGIKPMCLLCPKRGGAMKSTKSGTKWTHVSCALWIPEVSIGCPEKMEPITKISNIPPSRWALVCCLCKERVGACIQCSVKQCKTAFHVTCGFAHNLDMKTIVDESDEADGIHLRAYCPKHTKNRNASDLESPKKDFLDSENDISEAEMAKKRSEKLKQLEEEFYILVDTQEISKKFFIPEEAVDIVTEYWKMKRKVNNNKPLITPKMEEEDQMQKQQQDSLSARMKMFVHLRQDLERARNLCYMISKREKNKRQLFKMKENVFHAQIRVLTDPDLNLSAREAEKVRQEYYFDSIYSDYGVTSSRSSKQPRENLFTLENLKTPKDFDDSDDESIKNCGKVVDKRIKLGKIKVKEDKDVINCENSSTNSASVSEKSDGHHRESFFSMDGFKVLDDSVTESSEDESLATLAKPTHSSQVSRLGKVKLKEVEEKGTDGEPGDIKTIPESPTKKFEPSDLRKKLTSILQSKNMMHQRHEKVQASISEPVTEVLHVDVENSDSEVLTSDTNTDIMLPVDQPRNLFDQFRVQGKSMLSSPDIPQQDIAESSSHVQHKKIKTKKHSHSSYRHKRSRQIMLPSDQSSASSTIAKPESAVSVDTDVSLELGIQHLSDDTDMSSSPNTITHLLESDCHNHTQPPSSSAQSGMGKSRKQLGDVATSDSSGKSHHRTLAQASPSPRVNPNNIYATMDGDIYVPSGKIQVTERTIVLDDPKEEDRRPRSKLRLKKQVNSPVKGRVSYEVVKEEDDRHDIFGDKKHKNDVDEKRNIFESVMDAASSPLKFSDEGSSSSRHRNLRRHTKPEEAVIQKREKKSSETDTPDFDVKTKKEVDDWKGMEAASSIESHRKRKRSKPPLAGTVIPENDLKKECLTDENFKPKEGNFEKSAPERQEKRGSESVSMYISEKEVKKEVVEEKNNTLEGKDKSVKKDLFNVSTRRKRKKSKTPLTATAVSENAGKKVDSADENFKPKLEQSRDHTPMTRRSHTARMVQLQQAADEDDDDDEELEVKDSPPIRRRSTNNRNAVNSHADQAVVLKPLPGKPDLAALHDSRQLIVKEDLKRRVAAKLDKIIKGRRRWGSSNGIRDSSQLTIDKFVTRTISRENVFSKPDIVNDPNAKHLLLPLARSDLAPLQVNKSSSVNSHNGDSSDLTNRTESVPMSFSKTVHRNNVFGAHSTSRHILDIHNTPRKCESRNSMPKKSDENSDKDMLFGDMNKLQSPGLKEQLSFEDVGRNNDLAEVMKTPSKCDPAELSEDCLDGHRSYRSQSPLSSEGSGASSRLLQLDSRESTPSRRVTRSQFVEDTHSPSTRSKTRESLVKAAQLKLS